jgi:hypothetical protein
MNSVIGNSLMILCKYHKNCDESSCGRKIPPLRAKIGNELLFEFINEIFEAPENEDVIRVVLCPRYFPTCTYRDIAKCVYEASRIHLGAKICANDTEEM